MNHYGKVEYAMRNLRLYFLLSVLCILAGTSLVLISQTTPLAVVFQAGAINYPMVFALEGGFFTREGLQPKTRIFQSANDAQNALLGNSIFSIQ